MRKRVRPSRIAPAKIRIFAFQKLQTNILRIDKPAEMHENCDGNDELPDLDGCHEFGHRAGHFDFHWAQEVVLEMGTIFANLLTALTEYM